MLDTNVLSELMRPDATPSVVSWIAAMNAEDLRITAITRAEIMAGIMIMPPGRRRHALELAAERTIANGLGGSILSFDAEAADHYAAMNAARRRIGRSTASLDLMIAAIAKTHGAAVATRNVKDFEGCGIALHDPWREG